MVLILAPTADGGTDGSSLSSVVIVAIVGFFSACPYLFNLLDPGWRLT